MIDVLDKIKIVRQKYRIELKKSICHPSFQDYNILDFKISDSHVYVSRKKNHKAGFDETGEIVRYQLGNNELLNETILIRKIKSYSWIWFDIDHNENIYYIESTNDNESLLKVFRQENQESTSFDPKLKGSFNNNLIVRLFGEDIFVYDFFKNSIIRYDQNGSIKNEMIFYQFNCEFPTSIDVYDDQHLLIFFLNEKLPDYSKTDSHSDSSCLLWNFINNDIEYIKSDDNFSVHYFSMKFIEKNIYSLWAVSRMNRKIYKFEMSDHNLEKVFELDFDLLDLKGKRAFKKIQYRAQHLYCLAYEYDRYKFIVFDVG